LSVAAPRERKRLALFHRAMVRLAGCLLPYSRDPLPKKTSLKSPVERPV
jgi:hypothetical protein